METRKENPRKSWTELPNLLGDQKTVEEFCGLSNEMMGFAALGCIASANNRMRQAQREPGEPRFLYPTARDFPFDETVYKIVKALEERGFDVPGIGATIRGYGPNGSFRHVSDIRAHDFKLWFGRIQGSLGQWNDDVAVTTLNIPGKELHVYENNSGPRLHLYVGKDWEKDGPGFVNGLKVNSKLNNKPKTYLTYEGSWHENGGGIFYPGKLAPLLAHTNDLGREYDPVGDEPIYFRTEEVFQEFNAFFEGKLEDILKQPVKA